MRIHKIGAIDIGSNSIRLLITNVIPDRKTTLFKKSSMTRLPVRLGSDVFTKGKISKKNRLRLKEAMMAYKHIMNVHGVEAFRACATSAMREASNGPRIVEEIFEETGIQIEVIDGKEEARLIFNSNLLDSIQPDETSFLYIDVGGGSTELTLFHQDNILASKSFELGTIRLLNKLDQKESWLEFKDWIMENTREVPDLAAVGSGGNINKTFKMSGKRQGSPLDLDYLETTRDFLAKFTMEERVKRLGLNLDRADVIIPALRIFIEAMKAARADKIYVPKIGVSDGIVRDLYDQVRKGLITV